MKTLLAVVVFFIPVVVSQLVRAVVAGDPSGSSATLKYSFDGLNFFNATGGPGNYGADCIFLPAPNSSWVCCGGGSSSGSLDQITSSSNGTRFFSSLDMPFRSDVQGVCYGLGLVVAVGRADSTLGGANLAFSTDSRTWTATAFFFGNPNATTPGVFGGPAGCAFSPSLNRFVAVGGDSFAGGPVIAISNDGKNWTGISSSFDSTGRNVVWANNLFVALGGNDPIVMTSSDGIIFNRTLDLSANFPVRFGFGFGNGIWLGVGGDRISIEWTNETMLTNSTVWNSDSASPFLPSSLIFAQRVVYSEFLQKFLVSATTNATVKSPSLVIGKIGSWQPSTPSPLFKFAAYGIALRTEIISPLVSQTIGNVVLSGVFAIPAGAKVIVDGSLQVNGDLSVIGDLVLANSNANVSGTLSVSGTVMVIQVAGLSSTHLSIGPETTISVTSAPNSTFVVVASFSAGSSGTFQSASLNGCSATIIYSPSTLSISLPSPCAGDAGLSAGAIAGIVIGSFALVSIVVGIILIVYRATGKMRDAKANRSLAASQANF